MGRESDAGEWRAPVHGQTRPTLFSGASRTERFWRRFLPGLATINGASPSDARDGRGLRVLREVGVAIGGPIGAGKDDDALHHQMIPEALRLHDFTVRFAKTGTDGLGVLESTQADLFPLDADDPRPLMTALESVSEPVS